jgi:lipopolysaccharide transport system ATP-binding protein
MSRVAIRAEGLGKRYRIGERHHYKSMRELLGNVLRAPSKLAAAGRSGWTRNARDHIWALKGVSFDIREGEVLGLIGRNGAGKSTLLKILSRITGPTEGRAQIRGRVGSLLEVGTGFHPELTGRENVYLNGSILGMKKIEIDRKFDEIVAFSGVERFLETPLKHYSSGMQVRLAFAVAAHLEPEILLIDEVLAVGDIEFQKKCLGKMQEVSSSGRTIVFVSHNLGAVNQLCPRAIWIDKGRVVSDGLSEETAKKYMDTLSRGSDGRAWERTGSGRARFTSVEILDSDGNPCTCVPMGSDIRIRTAGAADRVGAEFNFSVQLVTTTGTIAVWAYDQLKTFRSNSNAEFLIDARLPESMLMPGSYFVSVWIGRAGQEEFDYVKNAARIDIIQSDRIPVTATVHNSLGLVYSPIEATQVH